MSVDVDQLVKDLESQAVKIATQKVMGALAKKIWVGFASPFVSPIVAYLVSIVVGLMVEEFDYLSYALVDGWEVTKEGQEYAEKSAELRKVQDDKTATKDQIKAAQEAKIDAARRLLQLGHSVPNN